MNQNVQSRLEQVAKLPAGARYGILAVIGLLIVTGYYFVFYQDARQDLERLQAKELELQRKLSEVRSVAANIAEFEEEIANLEVKLRKVLRQLPNEHEIEVLLTDISNLGKTAGVEIKAFERRDEVVHDFYAEVPIDLQLEGRYHDIARFFDMLAGLPRIVNVGSIDVKVGDDTLSGTTLTLSGTATTYRFVGNKGDSV